MNNDVENAILQLKSLAGQFQNQADAINMAIAQLEGKFEPDFQRLADTLAENISLKADKVRLENEVECLKQDDLGETISG